MKRAFGSSVRSPLERIRGGRAPSGSLAIVALAAATAGVWWLNRPSATLPRLESTAWLDPATAPVESLRLLPGIGPTLAERIDRARREGVSLDRADDLLQIPGIGPRRVEALRPLLRKAPRSSASRGSHPTVLAPSKPEPDSTP